MTEFQRDLETIINNTKIHMTEIEFNMRYFNRIKNRDIGEAALSLRGFNACRRNGIRTIDDAVNKWGYMAKFRGFGDTTIKDVKNGVLNLYYGTLNDEEKKQFWKDAFGGVA